MRESTFRFLTMRESTFRFWLKEQFNFRKRPPGSPKGQYWFNSNEAAYGGSIGTVDMWFLIPDTRLYVPVELKIAQILPNGLLRPSRIRPTQIAWHDELYRAGGRSCFLFQAGGLDYDVWLMPVCNRDTLKDWQEGLSMDDMLRVSAPGNRIDHDAWWQALRVVVNGHQTIGGQQANAESRYAVQEGSSRQP